MPTGPKGERRPAYVIGNAFHVTKIPKGEIEDTIREKNPHAVALGKLGGAKGGKARAAKLSAKRKHSIASKAANSDGATSPRSAASA